MEELRQKRKPLRAVFTRTVNSLEDALKAESPDVEKIKVLLDLVEDKGAKLSELDTVILERLQTEDFTEAAYNEEFEAIDGYGDRLIECRGKTKRFLNSLEEDRVSTSSRGSIPLIPKTRKFRLPEIEFKKFSGDIREWLGFWSQFRKINDDEDIPAEDKYQYLIQATVAGSRAREIVDSFPPAGENYLKVIQHLKDRFGRDDVQVEVYVRDLLRLVLKNTCHSKQNLCLSSLYDRLETQLRALETLGVTSDKYAAMLYPLVESCLPEELLRTWERNRNTLSGTLESTETNRLSLLMKFLRAEVIGEERVHLARTGFGVESGVRRKGLPKDKEDDPVSVPPTAAGLFTAQQRNTKERLPQTCVFCTKGHPSFECDQAKRMTLIQRRNQLLEKRCCFLCLKPGHLSRTCSKKYRCSVCHKRHCILLCPQVLSPTTEGLGPETPKVISTPTTDNALTNQSCSSNVALQTLKVFLRGSTNRIMVRALIDSGSQRSYITQDVVREMEFQRTGEELVAHNLFSGLQSTRRVHGRYRVHLSSLNDAYRCNFEVLDQARICSGIPGIRFGPWSNELAGLGIDLSDLNSLPGKQEQEEIKLLIGADVAGKLLTGRVHPLTCGAVAVETRLGWTLMGRLEEDPSQCEAPLCAVSLLVNEAKIADLWKLESIGIVDPSEKQTARELHEATLHHFRESVSREENGRYQVSLPWIDGHLPLSTGFSLAEKRLKSTVRKLEQEGLLLEYQAVLYDWLQQGIIEEVNAEYSQKRLGHYLPHRAVVKDNSATTRVRPVFDASAHEKNFPSLNSCLERGPNLIECIIAVLMRFRIKEIGVVSDIRQAFLQITVRESDRDSLRFLWWENGQPDKMKIYRHRRVVFGLSSSPFLLGATIGYHLHQASPDVKETADLLKDSFYVDNCVTSVTDLKTLKTFISQATSLMAEAQFDLRGWTFNVPQKDLVSTSNDDMNDFQSGLAREVPVLGLIWDREEDTLRCDLKGFSIKRDNPVTKRQLLSVAQSIYDPIGFVCPVMLFPKLQLQRCWNMKLTWDQELPSDMRRDFERWCDQICNLEGVRVPRWLGWTLQETETISFHVFCDASKLAYATCIFVRIESNGTSCQLIRARSRVAPLKEITLPRLELLACLIGARLADNVKAELRLADVPTFYWTDSTNALCWIRREDQWAPFVGNRAREIRRLSDPKSWRHVPGLLNPADVPSRGCTALRLTETKWWEGPPWLKLPQKDWPNSEPDPEEQLVAVERKRTVATVIVQPKPEPWYCGRFSSYFTLIRVTAWIRRFWRNCKSKQQARTKGELTPLEIKEAEISLFRKVQQDMFKGETDKNIRMLQPFCDQDGVLRLKTRLLLREDSLEFRYPILLPSKHPVVALLIQRRHEELCHAGIQTVLADLREYYWILKGRRTVRDVIKRCGRCRRFFLQNVEVPTAPLPVDRVRDADVFEVTGVDMAGPLILKDTEQNQPSADYLDFQPTSCTVVGWLVGAPDLIGEKFVKTGIRKGVVDLRGTTHCIV